MKTQKILTVAALMVVSYTVGKCRGISNLGKIVDKTLKKNYGLHIDKICYDLLRGKMAVDISIDDEEEIDEFEEIEETEK